jgi:hypothetical protein
VVPEALSGSDSEGLTTSDSDVAQPFTAEEPPNYLHYSRPEDPARRRRTVGFLLCLGLGVAIVFFASVLLGRGWRGGGVLGGEQALAEQVVRHKFWGVQVSSDEVLRTVNEIDSQPANTIVFISDWFEVHYARDEYAVTWRNYPARVPPYADFGDRFIMLDLYQYNTRPSRDEVLSKMLSLLDREVFQRPTGRPLPPTNTWETFVMALHECDLCEKLLNEAKNGSDSARRAKFAQSDEQLQRGRTIAAALPEDLGLLFQHRLNMILDFREGEIAEAKAEVVGPGLERGTLRLRANEHFRRAKASSDTFKSNFPRAEERYKKLSQRTGRGTVRPE